MMAAGPASEDEWRQLAGDIRAARPSMAPFHNIASVLEESAAQGTLGVHRALCELRRKEALAPLAIAEACLAFDGDVVVTLSYSGTVVASLQRMSKSRKMRAIVLESLPMGEGSITCSRLAEMDIVAEMVDDSMACAAMEEADICLVGADAVTPEGVVNKVGTANLALAARHFGKECLVLTSSLKVAPIGVHDLMPSEEFSGYRKRHQVFELVPLELFTRIVTDDGSFTPPSIVAAMSRRA